MEKFIEVPFGAKDSELVGWEYNIPKGMEATIVDNKIVVKKKENEDDKVRKELYDFCIKCSRGETIVNQREEFQRWAAWLEKQGEQKPTDEEIKILLQTEYEKGRADAIEQKSAWSEEDDIALNDALWCCKQAASIAKDENDMGNIWYAEKWLKLLKDRV